MAALLLLTVLNTMPLGVNAQSIRSSPPSTTLSASAGETLTTEFAITNNDAANQTYGVNFANFTSDGTSGVPKIVDDANFPPGISSWMSGLSSVSVASGATKNYRLIVRVPENTTAGTYYGMVMFRDTSTELTTSNASLVFVNVGTITETIAIDDLRHKETLAGENIASTYTFKAFIKNTGTGYTIPELTLTIRDADGMVIQTIDTENAGGILPGTTREYEIVFNEEIDVTKKHTATLAATTAGSNETTSVDFFEPTLASEPLPEEKDSPNVLLLLGIPALLLATIATVLVVRKRAKRVPTTSAAQQPLSVSPGTDEPIDSINEKIEPRS